jgi:hypothetical protein
MTPQISGTALLIPRVTDMRDGTHRPEVVIDDGAMGDIMLGMPVATLKTARLRADSMARAAAEALVA